MHFDLIIIGAGSGGIASARHANQHKIKTLLIEKSRTGGTCVNYGCVPKKITSNLASLLHQNHILNSYGAKTKYELDFAKFVQKRNEYILRLNSIYENSISSFEHVTYVKGEATLQNGFVTVNDTKYEYKKLILATGSQASKMYKKNSKSLIEGHNYLKTSDDFFHLTFVPSKSVIIGSGYISVEIAFILNQLGSDVTVVARGNKILSHFDEIIGENVKNSMISKGIKIQFDTDVLKVHENEIEICSNKSNDSKTQKITKIDFIMCAIGRDCNLDYIKDNINKTGNFIEVNDNFETSIKNVYAIGDLIGRNYMLTPYAIFCGRRLIEQIHAELNTNDKNNDQSIVQKYKINDYVPSVIFSHPPSASVGLSEAEAKKKYGDVKIYESKFINLFFSLCDKEEKEKSHFKIVTHNELVVGLHMFGMGCDEIVQGFSVAMKMGATFADFKAVVGVHPTASEEVVTMK